MDYVGNYDSLKKLYRVNVPILFTIEPYELEVYGVYQNYDNKGKPIFGTKDVNKNFAVRIDVSWSLETMINKNSEGCDIILKENDKLIEIYNNLDMYISSLIRTNNSYNGQIENPWLEKCKLFFDNLKEYNRSRVHYEQIKEFNTDNPFAAFVSTARLKRDNIGVTVIRNDEDVNTLDYNIPEPNKKKHWRNL